MSNRQGSVLNWSSSSVPNKDCKRNAEFLLTNASVNTCTLQDGAHSLGAKARPLTHWQITLRSAQGKHNISQPVTNHTQFCTGKHTLSIRQITTYSAQGKHSVSQPMTNHTQFCTGKHTVSIRQNTTYSAQGKHSVSRPMTNHTLIGLSFQSFLIFHVMFWACLFYDWYWWPICVHVCFSILLASSRAYRAIMGGVVFPNYGWHVHVCKK